MPNRIETNFDSLLCVIISVSTWRFRRVSWSFPGRPGEGRPCGSHACRLTGDRPERPGPGRYVMWWWYQLYSGVCGIVIPECCFLAIHQHPRTDISFRFKSQPLEELPLPLTSEKSSASRRLFERHAAPTGCERIIWRTVGKSRLARTRFIISSITTRHDRGETNYGYK